MDAIQNLYILFIQNKKKEAQLDIAPVQQVPCLVILRKWQFINFKEKETVFILRP